MIPASPGTKTISIGGSICGGPSLASLLRRRPFERHLCPRHSLRESGSRQRLHPCEQKPCSKSRWALDNEHPPQSARRWKESWIFEGVVLRAVAPGGNAQPPALSQMLTGRADPGVDQRIANGLR